MGVESRDKQTVILAVELGDGDMICDVLFEYNIQNVPIMNS